MKTKKITIEDLAVMVQKGLDESDARMQKGFDESDAKTQKGFAEMRDSFSRVNARLDVVETRLVDLDVVSRNEFDDLLGRVSYLERKLGIVSGK